MARFASFLRAWDRDPTSDGKAAGARRLARGSGGRFFLRLESRHLPISARVFSQEAKTSGRERPKSRSHNSSRLREDEKDKLSGERPWWSAAQSMAARIRL